MNHKSNVEFTIDGMFGISIFRGFAVVEAQYLPIEIERDTVANLSYIACLYKWGNIIFVEIENPRNLNLYFQTTICVSKVKEIII